MSFELLCATMIALIFGLALCFGGYRFFLLLLPIWGFFFGFALGAETIQALLGTAFLGTVTGWVVGFFAGAIFAVLSYIFYLAGVAFVAASLGYMLGVGLMGAIGIDFGFLAWIVGVVLAIIVAALTLFLNIQKYVIIAATSIGGAAMIVGTLMFGAEGLDAARAVSNPIRTMLQGNFLWTLVFLVIAILGIFVQIVLNRVYVIVPYENRLEPVSTHPGAD
ncbi:MAG TPA: DUF4203 domain-containing protein [Caldilineaceae bacterium]|nr:DUF4203 domain-containing protein [Caldilineaceae bacterium]